jgi:hypothetical protein
MSGIEKGCAAACMVFILLIVIILLSKYIHNSDRVRQEIFRYEKPKDNFNGTTSTSTGGSGNYVDESFTVQNNPGEPKWVGKEVAQRLHNLAEKGDSLAEACFNNSYPDKPISARLLERWKSIRKNNSFRETAFGEKSAAYTINKGDEMRICVRDPNKEKLFEDENTSMFVLIHEMAHLSSLTWGHETEFKDNFAKLVKAAVELGLYNYQDFRSSNEDYCGTEITNPAYIV